MVVTAAPLTRVREEGLAIWFLGTLMTLKATGEQTRGAYGLFEQVLPPGFAPPLHVHHREDEAFYLLEGEATFTCGEQTTKAEAGTYVFFPRDVPHWFHITGTRQARLLQFNFPAGVETFFVEAGEPATSLTLPPVGPLNFEKVALVATRYNIEILGSPPIS